MSRDYILIGIDGGATKVNAWSVDIEHSSRFVLGKYHSVKSFYEIEGFNPDFVPVNIQQQLKEFQSDDIHPTDAEIKQGKTYTQAAADVIIDITKQAGKNKILIGMGMPGLKTQDIRNIAVMANGPRNLTFCDDIERMIQEAGIEMVAPIDKLGSDAFYCGFGEEYAADGQFRKFENSYYLGGGTGAADALKLKGKLVSLDDIKPWFVKTWEMKNSDDISLEKCSSAKGIQQIYSDQCGISVNELTDNKIYSPQIHDKALNGEPAALKTSQIVATNFAALVYERISTLYAGWSGMFNFVNPAKPQPEKSHPYLGLLLDSVIIGQRLGDLFQKAKGDEVIWKPFVDKLTELIVNSTDLKQEAKDYYCPDKVLNEDLIKISKLREAPALGAAVDAYLSY